MELFSLPKVLELHVSLNKSYSNKGSNLSFAIKDTLSSFEAFDFNLYKKHLNYNYKLRTNELTRTLCHLCVNPESLDKLTHQVHINQIIDLFI